MLIQVKHEKTFCCISSAGLSVLHIFINAINTRGLVV